MAQCSNLRSWALEGYCGAQNSFKSTSCPVIVFVEGWSSPSDSCGSLRGFQWRMIDTIKASVSPRPQHRVRVCRVVGLSPALVVTGRLQLRQVTLRASVLVTNRAPLSRDLCWVVQRTVYLRDVDQRYRRTACEALICLHRIWCTEERSSSSLYFAKK